MSVSHIDSFQDNKGGGGRIYNNNPNESGDGGPIRIRGEEELNQTKPNQSSRFLTLITNCNSARCLGMEFCLMKYENPFSSLPVGQFQSSLHIIVQCKIKFLRFIYSISSTLARVNLRGNIIIIISPQG